MLPAHIGFVPVTIVIVTVGTTTGLTTIVIPALVAVNGLAQGELDVNMHVITCPFVNAASVYVGLFVPTFSPSTCHW